MGHTHLSFVVEQTTTLELHQNVQAFRCRRRNCLRLRWIRWTLPSCRSWIRIRFGRSSLRCCPTRRCSTCRCPNLGCQQIRCPSSTKNIHRYLRFLSPESFEEKVASIHFCFVFFYFLNFSKENENRLEGKVATF